LESGFSTGSLGGDISVLATEKSMDGKIQELLAPRITKHCLQLLQDGHFKHAAREAMVQVEIALKEKGRIEDLQVGAMLIGNLFAGKQGVKLRVPLGEELQPQAKKYFKGVFSYYRNYAAHDGSKIDEKISLRILIIASELLELIDASELTLADSGGVEGLVKIGEFGSAKRLGEILALLDEYFMPEQTYDGLFEDLAEKGFGEAELEMMIELNLVEMHSGEFETRNNQFGDQTEIMEWFQLTDLGKETLKSIEAQVD
jgi:hypothetical protein